MSGFRAAVMRACTSLGFSVSDVVGTTPSNTEYSQHGGERQQQKMQFPRYDAAHDARTSQDIVLLVVRSGMFLLVCLAFPPLRPIAKPRSVASNDRASLCFHAHLKLFWAGMKNLQLLKRYSTILKFRIRDYVPIASSPYNSLLFLKHADIKGSGPAGTEPRPDTSVLVTPSTLVPRTADPSANGW